MIANSFHNNPLLVERVRGWQIPRAHLKAMLDVLKIRLDPQTGRDFSVAIGNYLGMDITRGAILAVDSGRRSLVDFIAKDYRPALDKLTEAYESFREKNPTQTILVDVRIGDTLWAAAKLVDEYSMRLDASAREVRASLMAAHQQTYFFISKLQRRQSQDIMGFKDLKALVATGRCDGIVTLGHSFLTASMKRIFKQRQGVKFYDVVAVLSDLVFDNFSSRVGPQLYRICRDEVGRLASKTVGKKLASSVGIAAEAELAKLVGKLAVKCEELVVQGNSDPKMVGVAARFVGHCFAVFPKDERKALKVNLGRVCSSRVLAECFLASPGVADQYFPGWGTVVAQEVMAGLKVLCRHGRLETPIQRSRFDRLIPASGPVRALALSAHLNIIDTVFPQLVDLKGDLAPFAEIVAIRLQAERLVSTSPLDGLDFMTTLLRSMGLFASGDMARIDQDLRLLGGLIESGSVIGLAKCFHGLSQYFDERNCRRIASLYIADEFALLKDLQEFNSACSSMFVGRISVNLDQCQNFAKLLPFIRQLRR